VSTRAVAPAVAVPVAVRTPLQRPMLQRTCDCGEHTGTGGECHQCKKKKMTLQRHSDGSPGPVTAPPIVREVLRRPGHLLDARTREFMESAFSDQVARNGSAGGRDHEPNELSIGSANDHQEREADRVAMAVMEMQGRSRLPQHHDFSRIRVHSDERAAEAAQSVHAQAFTVGSNLVFGAGRYAPHTRAGRQLLAHELAHTLQQQSVAPLRRKLSVDQDVPANAPANDPARSLSKTTRFSMMDSLIRALCPKFRVNSSGEVESATLQSIDRKAIAAGANSTGCCCLDILADPAASQWTIEVSGIIGAETDFGTHQVFLNPTNTPVEFGAFTGSNKLAFQGAVPTAGHELCGHAALEEVQAHPSGQDRLQTDVHNPTVHIENQISTEQGVAAGDLRGEAASGSHRGESVDKITIRGYPFDKMEVPASEQSKLKFAAQYIFTPAIQQDEYVSIVGHSDNVGSAAAKQAVSVGRAQKVKAALRAEGVPETITKHSLPTTARFTSVKGVSDSQPPAPPLDVDQANWRRVDILMAGFPAGAQTPPAATPTGVTPHTQNPNVPALKTSSDPCIKKLVTTAYP
jgi:outer membrane protein OmpA-like peptidoglycan-associated protein